MIERIGIYEKLDEPYQKYLAGPFHVTLYYSSYNSKLIDSCVEFKVVNSEDAIFLDTIPEILSSSEFHWSSIKESSFKRDGLTLKLIIDSDNVVDCLDFFLNNKIVV